MSVGFRGQSPLGGEAVDPRWCEPWVGDLERSCSNQVRNRSDLGSPGPHRMTGSGWWWIKSTLMVLTTQWSDGDVLPKPSVSIDPSLVTANERKQPASSRQLVRGDGDWYGKRTWLCSCSNLLEPNHHQWFLNFDRWAVRVGHQLCKPSAPANEFTRMKSAGRTGPAEQAGCCSRVKN